MPMHPVFQTTPGQRDDLLDRQSLLNLGREVLACSSATTVFYSGCHPEGLLSAAIYPDLECLTGT